MGNYGHVVGENGRERAGGRGRARDTPTDVPWEPSSLSRVGGPEAKVRAGTERWGP